VVERRLPGEVGAKSVNGATVRDEQQSLVATLLVKGISEVADATPKILQGLAVRGMRAVVNDDVILNPRK
jgi:hypothetical protein